MPEMANNKAFQIPLEWFIILLKYWGLSGAIIGAAVSSSPGFDVSWYIGAIVGLILHSLIGLGISGLEYLFSKSDIPNEDVLFQGSFALCLAGHTFGGLAVGITLPRHPVKQCFLLFCNMVDPGQGGALAGLFIGFFIDLIIGAPLTAAFIEDMNKIEMAKREAMKRYEMEKTRLVREIEEIINFMEDEQRYSRNLKNQ